MPRPLRHMERIMPTFTLFIAAIIQGITEFLPISSSAHLYLWNHFNHIAPGGFPYDMVLNAGTLLATMIYFRLELIRMITDVLKQCAGKGSTQYSHLAWLLVLATVPACVVGLLIHDLIETHLRSIALMGGMMMIFGLLLGLSDRSKSTSTALTELSFKQALCIGLAQIFSLIPGASRSGTTITAARFLGLNRDVSVRFSFLLAIPVTLAAVSLDILKAFKHQLPFEWSNILIAFAVSAGVGILCIHVLLKLITNIGFMPFAIYRLILGAGLLYYFW